MKIYRVCADFRDKKLVAKFLKGGAIRTPGGYFTGSVGSGAAQKPGRQQQEDTQKECKNPEAAGKRMSVVVKIAAYQNMDTSL